MKILQNLIMERKRYIKVPKNERSMNDYDYGVQNNEQTEILILDDNQYMTLNKIGIFNEINKKCDIIIDDYEEEVLEFKKIPVALDIVDEFILHYKNDELVKLKEMLNLASMYKTFIAFDF